MPTDYVANRPRRSLSGRKSATYFKKCSNTWNDRELLFLASAYQKYGYQDPEKMSLMIETKDETAVRSYIQQQIRNFSSIGLQKYKLEYGEAADWKMEQKWQRIIHNFMSRSLRRDDYSKIVMPGLCKRFMEEAKECKNPQVFDAKAFYKFLQDIFMKNMPVELPPKESAILLAMLKLFRDTVSKNISADEINFIRKFRRPSKFVPMEVKQESMNQMEKDSASPCPGGIKIPYPLFCMLSRHRRVVQSFNPLVVPIWTLAARQQDLCQLLETQLHIE